MPRINLRFLIYPFLLSLHSLLGQIPNYDKSVALDCSRDRYLVVSGKRVFVPKGSQFLIAKFNGWGEGMYEGDWSLILGNKDTVTYPLAVDYLLCNQCLFASLRNDSSGAPKPIYMYDSASCPHTIYEYFYCRKVWFKDSILYESGNYYQFLVAYLPYTDTIEVPGDPLFGNVVFAMSKIGHPFYLGDYYSNAKCLRCALDASQYGIFVDTTTGEMLKFSDRLNVVYYKSKKQKEWKKLFAYDVHPGCLRISFSADHSDGGYYLWYSGKDWVLSGKWKDGYTELQYKPQFFKKLKL